MAANPNTSAAFLDTTFDYQGVKEKYMEQIRLYYFGKNLAVITPWTRKVISKIISIIKEGNRLAQIGYPSNRPRYRIMNKYRIAVENGEEKLVYKSKNPEASFVEVVGAEDCFEIITEAHISTGHGGPEKVMNALRQKYSVPKTSIDFILALCNVCSAQNTITFKRRADNKIPQLFRSRGQVSIIDMTFKPDNQFKYILFYLDRFTRFMLLRPLVNKNETEVAMELLKIFADIGYPDKLETYDRVFFSKVLTFVQAAYGNFQTSLLIPVKLPEITAADVEGMLQRWQEKSGSNNWAMGCYIVQWESNNTYVDGKSPYQSAFLCKSQSTMGEKDRAHAQSRQDGSKDASSQSTSVDSVAVPDLNVILIDSDEEKGKNVFEIAEITDENGEILATIPSILDNINQFVAEQSDRAVDPKLSHLSGGSIISVNTTQPEISNMASIDDEIPASMIMKPPDTPKNKKCHVCKTFITKPYSCTECKRPVHLFCSDRLMKQDVPLDVLDVTCTACKLNTNKNITDVNGGPSKKKKIA